jgi:hypothetical protein
MQDPDDDMTLPLVDSVCKHAFCQFIGAKAFEGDGGWSYEVWRTAWNMALLSATKSFENDDDANYYGDEVAHALSQYVQK